MAKPQKQPNPFDEFDAPLAASAYANPFDEFDTETVPTPAKPFVDAGILKPSAADPRVRKAPGAPEMLRPLEYDDPLTPRSVAAPRPMPPAPEGYSGGILKKSAPPGVPAPDAAPPMLAMSPQQKAGLDQERRDRAGAEADAIGKDLETNPMYAPYRWDRDVATPFLQKQAQSAMQTVDPDQNVSRFISENVTPIAERVGSDVGGMLEGHGEKPRFGGAAQEMGAATGAAVSDWAAMMAKDPFTGAAQANEALNPASLAGKATNSYGDALAEAFGGNWGEAQRHMNEGNMNAVFAAMGFSPAKGVMAATDDVISGLGKGGPSLTSQIFKPGPTPMDRAVDLIIRKMEDDGLTIEQIASTARSLANRSDSGVYETLSEVAAQTGGSSGANLRGFAMALGSIPGPAQEALLRRIAENSTKLSQRVNRAASRATGQEASKTAATLDELDARLKVDSKQNYDAFYASDVDANVFANEIAATLNTEHGLGAMRSARRGLKTQEASLKAAVASGRADMKPELDRITASVASLEGHLKSPKGSMLTPEAMDHVKRAFDDQIEAAGQGSYTANALRSAKRNFAESVSRATGGKYGEALGRYEGKKRLDEAFDIGLNALKQPTWQLERAMAAGNRGSPFTAGEIEALALGVARYIDDLVESNNQVALTRLTKDKALKNLSTALNDPKAAALFEESIQRLAANREWGRRVSGGSDTAMRLAAIDDATRLEEDPITRALDRAKNATVPPTITGLLWGATGKPAIGVAEDVYRRFKYPGIRNKEVNAAVAPFMARAMTKSTVDELSAAIQKRIEAKGPKKLPPPPMSPPPVGPPASRKRSLPAPAPKPPAKQGFNPGGPIASQVIPPAAAATFASVGPEGESYEDKLPRMLAAAGAAAGLRNAPALMRATGAGSKGPFKVDDMTFGGVNAKTADKIALGRAQNMEASGASRDDIWKETGWFKGVDNKWKFEIPDNQAQLKELTPYDTLRERVGIPRTLDRVMTDPDAGGAYPKLRDLPAYVEDAGPGPSSPRGEYDPRRGGRIRVAEAPAAEQRSTLLHERQHAIQRSEDFARGGRGNGTVDVEDYARSLYETERAVDQSLPPWSAADEEIKDVARSKAAHEIYLLQAGEVEARTVQKRADYSPEQRRARPPWQDYDRPETEQIINFGSSKNENRGSGRPPPEGPKPPGAGDEIAQRLSIGYDTPAGVRDSVGANVYHRKDGTISVDVLWPSNIGDDLGNALVKRTNEFNGPRKGLKVVDDEFGAKPPRSPEWAEQNPTESRAMVEAVAQRIIGLSRGKSPAVIVSLLDGYDNALLAKLLSAGRGRHQTVIRTRDGGEIAVVDTEWLAQHPKRFPRAKGSEPYNWEPVGKVSESGHWPSYMEPRPSSLPAGKYKIKGYSGGAYNVFDESDVRVSGGEGFLSKLEAQEWLDSVTPPGGAGKGPPAEAGGPPNPKARKGPPKPIEPKSEEERALRAAVKKARSDESVARRRYMMRDNREEFWAPYEERSRIAEENLNRFLRRQASRRAMVGKAKDFGKAVGAPIKRGFTDKEILAGAGIGGGSALAVGGLMALDDFDGNEKKPTLPDPGAPDYFWQKSMLEKDKVAAVQTTLDAWRHWDRSTPMNGSYGPMTKDGVAVWLSEADKKGMTREAAYEFFAGPDGYKDEKDNWRYADGEMVKLFVAPLPKPKSAPPPRPLSRDPIPRRPPGAEPAYPPH
jgi:hypothetical protein